MGGGVLTAQSLRYSMVVYVFVFSALWLKQQTDAVATLKFAPEFYLGVFMLAIF